MCLPGDGKARKQKGLQRLGGTCDYLVGLPVGTWGALLAQGQQAESQSRIGAGPAALCSTDQTGWGIPQPR